MMMDDVSVGHWLRQRRQALGLTQKALAQVVGCAVITLQKLEAGERRASTQMAERLATALGIAAQDLDAFVAFARSQGDEPHPPGLQRQTEKAGLVRHNIPYALTPLHGRERELALITNRLRQGQRLITLSGPPGIGKTRLAMEAAHALLPNFADGVCFVALETIVNADMVVPIISQALALQTVGDRPLLGQLVVGLRDRHMLLVLDNFEQVLSAATAVATLLSQCPWLSVLVTSRIPLHLHGEAQVEVTPLTVPDDSVSPAVLQQFSSIALFVERAIAVRADFTLSEENAAVLTRICQRLDGLPLAIELVAGQTKLLPPAQLLDQLEAHADWLLSLGERRVLSVRQVTLRTAIHASFDLLTPQEQDLLASLAVFVGGFTLAAAEAVGGQGVTTLITLGALRDKSLLQEVSSANSDPRFSMLSAVRKYMQEALAAELHYTAAYRRHADYFVALAKVGAAQLHGANQVIWLERLLAELDNCRAALNWLLDSGDLAAATQLVVALGPLWIVRSLLAEGRQAATRVAGAVATSGAELPPHLAAQLDNMQGSLAFYAGDALGATANFQHALDRARAINEQREMAYALDGMAAVAIMQGKYERAWDFSQRSLTLSRAVGDGWLTAITLLNLGEIARYQHDLTASDSFYRESLDILRDIGDRSFAAIALHNLGQVAFDLGQMSSAATYQQESLKLGVAVLDYRLIARAFERLGEIALAQERPTHTARLLGAAAALQRTYSVVAQPVDQASQATLAKATQRLLDESMYEAATAEGRSLTLQEAVELALTL
jgi:predicted ATPase/DNA-binding XRE family transcriptional regulator